MQDATGTGSPGAAAAGLLLGVDVGGTKTALAVADRSGRVRFAGRGPGASADELGEAGCLDVVRAVLADAGAPTSGYAAAALAVAGVDQPEEEEALAAVARERGLVAPAGALVVVNDLFAVLRSAADHDGGGAHGVAVIAGTGTNAVGLDGERTVRFLSLGAISGDWGGGPDLGTAALGAACRAQDGRGPATALVGAVLQHYGTATVADAVLAVHRRTGTGAPSGSLAALAPAVLAAADAGDAVAVALVARLAGEVADFARACADRLQVPLRELPVVLGGGLLHARTPRLSAEVHAALEAAGGTGVRVRFTDAPPVVGSLLLAFDALAAGAVGAADVPDAASLAAQLGGGTT